MGSEGPKKTFYEPIAIWIRTIMDYINPGRNVAIWGKIIINPTQMTMAPRKGRTPLKMV